MQITRASSVRKAKLSCTSTQRRAEIILERHGLGSQIATDIAVRRTVVLIVRRTKKEIRGCNVTFERT